MPTPTPASLTAHAKKTLTALLKDAVLAPESAADLKPFVQRALKAWSGEALPSLFAAASEPAEHYALAALAASAPDFEPMPALELASSKKLGPTLSVAVSDVTVTGPLDLYDGQGLVVLGDLSAREVSVDESSFLVVTGDLTARVASGSGWLLVGGDVHAEAVFGAYEAGELRVAGSLDAKVAVFRNHVARLGAQTVKHLVKVWRDDAEGTAALAKLAALVPASAVKGGAVDLKALRSLAASGKPVLRGEQPRR